MLEQGAGDVVAFEEEEEEVVEEEEEDLGSSAHDRNVPVCIYRGLKFFFKWLHVAKSLAKR